MRACGNCGEETSPALGGCTNGRCASCHRRVCTLDEEHRMWRPSEAKRLARNRRRREREQALRDLGLKKVRGSLGGVYWE